MLRRTRYSVLLAAVGIVAAAGLTACSSDDDSGDSGTQAADDRSAASDCAVDPPAGPLEIPAEKVSYRTVSTGFTVTREDGSEDCFTASGGTGGLEPEGRSGPDFDLRLGDGEAGLVLSGREGAPDSLPGTMGRDFIGVQFDGAYYYNGLSYSSCQVEYTSMNGDQVAGAFTCTELPRLDPGPFPKVDDAPAPAETIQGVEGWFVAKS